jgi:hypothetical protein
MRMNDYSSSDAPIRQQNQEETGRNHFKKREELGKGLLGKISTEDDQT